MSSVKRPGLSWRLKLAFGSGDVTTSAPLAVIAFYQLFFLTDVAGLPPAYAAWSLLAARIWDAVNDPVTGILADRLRSRLGCRRVLLLIGAAPLGVAFMLMWLRPDFGAASPAQEHLWLAVYYAAVFILFDTFYTIVHIGYNSLTPELSRDYDERSSINGYRMFYSILAALLAIGAVGALEQILPSAEERFFWLGAGLGAVAILPPLLVFAVTRPYDATGYENDAFPAASAPLGFLSAARSTLRNRPFWLVMGLYLFSWTTASILAANLVYFANYYLRVPDQATLLVLTAQAAAIGFIPVWVQAARRMDKRRAFMLGAGTWIFVLLGISLLQRDQVVFAYILAFLAGSGIATAYVLPWAMIPDIVEFDALQTGQRREGAFYAFAAFFQKLGTAAALWAMAQALEFSGYITPASPDMRPLPEQPVAALDAIRIFIGPAPALLLIAAIAFAWRYPHTRERHRAAVEELAQIAGK